MNFKLTKVVFLTKEKLLKAIMRTFIFLWCVVAFAFGTENSFSQKAKIEILSDQTVSVKEVFDIINKQTDYKFIYRHDVIKNAPEVQLNKGTIKVSELLTKSLDPFNFTYVFTDNNTVVVKEKEETTAVATPTSKSVQQTEISGTITDGAGMPLPGVNVLIKGTKLGTVSDFDGNYRIAVNEGDVLEFSYVGYATRVETITGIVVLNIQLEEDTQTIDEVVVVGYGSQKKGNVTGSVATVKGADLIKAPMASTSNAITGRLPGVITKQGSGAPGQDNARISIRGFGAPLVIVDGVAGDFNTIDANEIETISVLKDASAAIYGARAGNGVILVTTKRGKTGKARVTLNSSYTSQSNTIFLKPVNSGQFTEMQRQRWHENGRVGPAPFSEYDIAKYYAGNNPDYPSTNWFDEVMRDSSPMQQHNLSVSGGTEKVKYFAFVGYLNQQSFLKSDDGKYSRFNVRSNLDAQISDNFSVRFDLSSIVGAREYPFRGANRGGDWFADLWSQQPIYESFTPTNDRYPYTGATTSIVPQSMREGYGYQDDDNQNIKGALALNYSVPFIEGLKVRAFTTFSKDYIKQKLYERPYTTYTYNNESDEYIQVGYLNNSVLTHRNTEYQEITGQFSLNYQRTFGDHTVSALAMYEVIDSQSTLLAATRGDFLVPEIDYLFGGSEDSMSNYGSASETGRASLIGRLNYSYKGKYLIESTIRRDASAKFASDVRWGTFPSLSLGWRISEEDFIQNSSSVINQLKIRGGASKTGNDGVGNFLYLAGYNFSNEYTFGNSLQKTLLTRGVANPNLTWEEITIYNLGLEFGLWNNKLHGEIDVFSRDRDGIPGYRSSSLPNTLGINPPLENLNSQNTQGFEVLLGTSSNWGEFKYDISANVSYARSKWTYVDEVEYTDPDQIRLNKLTGNWIDRTIGFRTDGLYTSQAEIDAMTFEQDGNLNKTLRPGDIKYIDTNKDGVLDWRDQEVIGNGAIPHWIFGINSNFTYKNFDLSMLFQGAFDYSVYNNLSLNVGSTAMYENRWTEENNNPNALVPRLGSIAGGGGYNDYYLKNSNYIRLKNLSFGYALPKQWIEKVGVENMRIYFAGTNLFTIDDLKKYGVDPEVTTASPGINQSNQHQATQYNDTRPVARNGAYYPQQRTLTFGLNLTF